MCPPLIIEIGIGSSHQTSSDGTQAKGITLSIGQRDLHNSISHDQCALDINTDFPCVLLVYITVCTEFIVYRTPSQCTDPASTPQGS